MGQFPQATIQSVTASSASGSPTSITRDDEWTIAFVTTTATESYVSLPTNAEVGDVVEVSWSNPTASTHVFTGSSAETFLITGSSVISGNADFAFLMRKVTSSFWSYTGGPL